MRSTANSEKYHFGDFTYGHYRDLLRTAKAQYWFLNNADEEKPKHANRPVALWRHDIDFSPQNALDLARLEADEGVRSTYFLLLHSEFYNLLDAAVTRCVDEIISLGHRIGLHFDSHFYGIQTAERLIEYLNFERQLLQKLYRQPIHEFSFHKNSTFTLGCQEAKYAGMVNMYSADYKSRFKYLSDSNGYWRFGRLTDFLREYQLHDIQVLTHPEWWTMVPMSPVEKVERILTNRSDQSRKWYVETLREFQRENIDW